MAGSTGVVVAAMIANGAIAVLKFLGFLLTGSPSMLAETYHSISDTGNQVLLLVGIKYSQREADRTHPLGYGRAQFFYAFLVSVLLFGIAGWESLGHGIEKVRHGGTETEAGSAEFLGYTVDVPLSVDPFWVSVAILLGAIAFETYAFLKARAELQSQMERYGWSSYRGRFAGGRLPIHFCPAAEKVRYAESGRHRGSGRRRRTRRGDPPGRRPPRRVL